MEGLKQTKMEENIKKKGDDYVFSSIQEVTMDRENFLRLVDREKTAVEEARKGLKQLKQTIKTKSAFVDKIKDLIKEASEIEDTRYCKKCGLDMIKEPKYRYNNDTCKNCHRLAGVV